MPVAVAAMGRSLNILTAVFVAMAVFLLEGKSVLFPLEFVAFEYRLWVVDESCAAAQQIRVLSPPQLHYIA